MRVTGYSGYSTFYGTLKINKIILLENYTTRKNAVTSVTSVTAIQKRGENMKILAEKEIARKKGCSVWLQHIEDSTPPSYANWRVEFAGNGHYFPTLAEAENYLRKRRFLKGNEQICERFLTEN